MQIILVITALLFFGACSSAPQETRGDSVEQELPTPLHVKGQALHDAEGRTVLLHGVNWSGGWKLTPYGADATEEEAKWIAAQGMNHVRLLTGWAAIMPEEGKLDRAYLANLRRRAEWAQKYDLFVIADMHQDIYGEGIVTADGWVLGNGAPAWTCRAVVEPLSPWMVNYIQDGVGQCYDRMYTEAHLISLFAEAHHALLETLGDMPNFLGVEILNEPFIGMSSPLRFDIDVLTPFYDSVYARIATAAAGHLIFAEPSIVKNLAALGLLPRLPSEQSVYSPHLYDARQELGEGYDGSTVYLDFRFDVDVKDSAFLNAPLWIGEWGNPPAGDAARRYINDFLDRADATLTSRAFWEFGLMRGRPEVVKALARPYVERAPGKPVFSYDPESRQLKLQLVGDGKNETWVRAPKGWRAATTLEGPWQGVSSSRDTGSALIILPPLAEGEAGSATLTFTE